MNFFAVEPAAEGPSDMIPKPLVCWKSINYSRSVTSAMTTTCLFELYHFCGVLSIPLQKV